MLKEDYKVATIIINKELIYKRLINNKKRNNLITKVVNYQMKMIIIKMNIINKLKMVKIMNLI